MGTVEVKKVLLEVPYSRIWTSYDKEADVLYINFKKPSQQMIPSSRTMIS